MQPNSIAMNTIQPISQHCIILQLFRLSCIRLDISECIFGCFYSKRSVLRNIRIGSALAVIADQYIKLAWPHSYFFFRY